MSLPDLHNLSSFLLQLNLNEMHLLLKYSFLSLELHLDFPQSFLEGTLRLTQMEYFIIHALSILCLQS